MAGVTPQICVIDGLINHTPWNYVHTTISLTADVLEVYMTTNFFLRFFSSMVEVGWLAVWGFRFISCQGN